MWGDGQKKRMNENRRERFDHLTWFAVSLIFVSLSLRLLLSNQHPSDLHELIDLKSHLQVDKLRELSLAYAQSMHDLHADETTGAAVGGATPPHPLPASAAGQVGLTSMAYAAAAYASTPTHPSTQFGGGYSGVMPLPSSIVDPSSNSSSLLLPSFTPALSHAPSTVSTAAFRLLQRVEQSVEVQDTLRAVAAQVQELAITGGAGASAGGAANTPAHLSTTNQTGVTAVAIDTAAAAAGGVGVRFLGRPPDSTPSIDPTHSAAGLSSLMHFANVPTSDRIAYDATDAERDDGHEATTTPNNMRNENE